MVYPVILRNAFFAYLENILGLMMIDESNGIRELTQKRIKKVRQTEKGKDINIIKLYN